MSSTRTVANRSGSAPPTPDGSSTRLQALTRHVATFAHAAIDSTTAFCFGRPRNLPQRASGFKVVRGRVLAFNPQGLAEVVDDLCSHAGGVVVIASDGNVHLDELLGGREQMLAVTFDVPPDTVAYLGVVRTADQTSFSEPDERRLASIASVAAHLALLDLPSLQSQRRELLIESLHCLVAELFSFDTNHDRVRLSNRERQIARHLVNGYTTLNIASILNLSENTIRTYVRRLYRKLKVFNRADLARSWHEPAPE